VVLHPHPVAQDRSARERARRVYRNHPRAAAAGAEVSDDTIHQAALPDAGWTRHPHNLGPPSTELDLRNQTGVGVLGEESEEFCQRTPVASERALDEVGVIGPRVHDSRVWEIKWR